MGELTAQIYRDDAAFDTLRDAWLSLVSESPPVTPWQQWDFISVWWQRIANDPHGERHRQLRVILIRRGDQPCLLVPLQLQGRPGLRMRWLEPIGMPDDIHRPRFAIGALDAGLYGAAIHAIQSLAGEWDGLRIDEKTVDDAELALLRRLAQPVGWRFRAVPLHACPYLDLGKSWPAYLATRSPKLRKNLGSARRRLQSHGAVRLERFDSLEQVKAGFELLLEITSRSWKQSQKIGLGASEHYRSFYREFVARMAARNCARLYCLYAGDRPVAATLAFIDGSTYYSTQIAHDGAFDQYSPGTLLEAMEMEALIAEGRFRTFDFLGAALANKRRWTDTMHSTQRVVWLAQTLRARIFETLYFQLKPRLLALRETLQRQRGAS